MTHEQAILLSRVRLLALRSLVAAGGEPDGRQLLRAIEPVLGDLLTDAATPAGDAQARQLAAAAGLKWRSLDRTLSDRFAAVDGRDRHAGAKPPGRS